MEPLRPEHPDADDARPDVPGAGTTLLRPASVGELTERQLELQRRLVRESLLLRSA